MSKYIDNIDDCTVKIFRHVINKNDYSVLLLSGQYNEDESKSSWEKIFNEYQDNIRSTSLNYQFEKQKQLDILINDYNLIQYCLNFISIFYEINLTNDLFNKVTDKEILTLINIDEIVKLLNKYNYRFDSKNIINELDRVKRQSKNILNKINSDIEKLKEKQDKPASFDSLFSKVCKHMGYYIPDHISIRLYTEHLNDLLNSKNNG